MKNAEELRAMLRREIQEEELFNVVGGNDDMKNKGTPWVCHFCGATVMVLKCEDGPKHMTKCPNNPYK